MAIHQFKTVAMVSAMVLGITLVPFLAKAAPSASVGVSVTTASTITTTLPVDLSFNQWLIIIRSAETVDIVMNHLGALSFSGNTNSTIQALNGTTGTPGSLSVDLPDGSSGTILQMSRTAAGGTMGAGLALQAVTYSTVAEGNNVSFPVGAVPVTVASGATPEVVTFGGTIRATATPTDGTHTDSFDVTFAY